MDIVAISETQLADNGQVEEVGEGFTYFWKGKPKDEDRESGVGFAIRSSLVQKLEELPVGINDRIISLRLSISKDRYATLLSIYAPTMTNPEEDKTAFYSQLREVLRSVPKDDKIFLMGDFNARVGTDSDTWSCLGNFGVGNMNSNGLLLLELCEEFSLSISSTVFKHKGDHTTTWMHPRSKTWHLIDYVIVRKRDMKDVCNVKSFHGAECWTDHALVRAKVKLHIKPKARSNNIRLPKRLNISKLNDPTVKQELVAKFDLLNDIESWESFRDDMYNSAADVLGLSEKKHQDWFDENNEQIKHLLSLKKNIHSLTLQSHLSQSQKLEAMESYKTVKKKVQSELRSMENKWWDDLASQIEAASERNDSKTLYNLLNKAYGPQKSGVTPLRSKDGKSLLSETTEISNRWREHFSDLLNQPSSVDNEVVDSIEQRPTIEQLALPPTREEVSLAIKKLNLGKAAGSDGLFAEIFMHGGEHLKDLLHTYLCKLWGEEHIPEDWINAIMIAIYKNKGLRDDCGNYRGIALLVTAGKILSGILLKRLNDHIANLVLPETQCGFRASRGTADMIFTARQMQEKCREQMKDLYQCFIDLKKAFDTVHRKSLWKILRKIGCPDKFVSMIEKLHDGMKAWVNVSGELTDPIEVENGVKQGDILGPTLFSLYLAMVFEDAFKDNDRGIYIKYRTTGKVFDLRRLEASTKVSYNLIRDLLYADDCDLVTHTEEDMQQLMDCISRACKSFGLTISIEKTKVMYQPAPGKAYAEPNIMVDDERLEVVKKFVYLGSTLNNSCTLNDEILARIQKATDAFRALEARCWKKRSIKLTTKIKVYSACVLSSLLYSCETWALYKKHLKILERFHQRSLRHIMNISWSQKIPDTEVLERSGLGSIESLLLRHRLRWAGKLVCMSDSRLPKQVFFGALAEGKRPQHKPKLRFKDCLKRSLEQCKMNIDSWQDDCSNETEWKSAVSVAVAAAESSRIDHEKMKRCARKHEEFTTSASHLACDICSRICLSKAGLKSHMRSHENQPAFDYADIEQFQCSQCNKVCKSSGGLKRHMNMHAGEQQPSSQGKGKQKINCPKCDKLCNSLAGLKSHMRAHARTCQE